MPQGSEQVFWIGRFEHDDGARVESRRQEVSAPFGHKDDNTQARDAHSSSVDAIDRGEAFTAELRVDEKEIRLMLGSKVNDVVDRGRHSDYLDLGPVQETPNCIQQDRMPIDDDRSSFSCVTHGPQSP